MPYGPPQCDFCENSGGMEIMFRIGVWPCPYGCPPEDDDMRREIEYTALRGLFAKELAQRAQYYEQQSPNFIETPAHNRKHDWRPCGGNGKKETKKT